ncbi:Rap1a/Tai family immunity protein [Methylococcus sp. EFPC2]|uniref:Rap1a/Tai family immunity protein n=1 Tax=Methylococcus sp. EFPC2 TaxID=2812648 RepID=UPI00196746B8|nr:Rap1a/Tai family immunity protein [Methylococcus sp. EFPC2]QSA97783.1 hypothetical protein JWZ97_02835 [Methylococcus sp. EFPC2]
MPHASHFSSAAVALALAVLPAVSLAVEPINFEIRNNADLAAVCSTQPADPNYIAAIHFCHGIGVGLVRYQEALQEGKDVEPIFCLPKSLTRAKAVETYLGYAKAHPEYDQEAVGNVLIKYLSETYPCSKGSSADSR